MRAFRSRTIAIPFALFTFVVAGCASTPTASEENLARVFPVSLEQTQVVALEALAEVGFDVTKNDRGYVEGFRPRKVGLAVGSGGETIGVWMSSVGSDSTRVQVRTAKSFVGIVGQKNWDEPVLDAMSERLGK